MISMISLTKKAPLDGAPRQHATADAVACWMGHERDSAGVVRMRRG